MANTLAIHMKMNISSPTEALMFNSGILVRASRIRLNMTVATIEAAVVATAAINVITAIGKAAHRVKIERGAAKIMTVSKQAPSRNKPNIHREAVLTRSSTLRRSAGKATLFMALVRFP